jgi:crotonobetainyl-CoA:carnitine CoA-transferase CaiB-like acyl-CoA transferase
LLGVIKGIFEMERALEKIRILDFGQAYLGSFCTLLLRELGAEVIKIERPAGGDILRTQPPLTEAGESINFIVFNRGKKNITLNLASEMGHDICLELVKWADVTVENFRPGVMDRLGLGYEEVSKVNPRIIYASLSGFGKTGPRSSEPGFDVIAQAAGGIPCIEGFPDDPPSISGIPLGDYIAPFYATIAILAALNYRSETGEGQMIDISQQDAIWALVGMQQGVHYFLTNKIPQRFGSGMPTQVPFGIYPAKDGHVVIAIGTVAQWETFLKVIERDDLIGVERYATANDRVNHRDEVNALVTEWTETRSKEEIVNILKANRLACTLVHDFPEVANDSQLLFRDMIIEVEQILSGKVKMPGSVFKLSKTPGNVRFPSPFLGEHNYEIYCGMLGYSEEEIKKLQDEGII